MLLREPTIRVCTAAILNAAFAFGYFLAVLQITSALEDDAVSPFLQHVRTATLGNLISLFILFLAMGNCGPLAWLVYRGENRPRFRLRRLVALDFAALLAACASFIGLMALSVGSPPHAVNDLSIALTATSGLAMAQVTLAAIAHFWNDHLRLRRREQRQCEACGYTLRQPPWNTCTECGWRRGMALE